MRLLLLAMMMFAATVHAAGDNSDSGDTERGRVVFFQCRTCHYAEKDYGHHNGPNLYGIFGRTAGTAPNFLYYSDAMKRAGAAGFRWTPELLDVWLANPRTMISGTSMVVFDLDAQRRADLIEYLKQFRDK
jgi:cytochrome c